MGMPWQDYAGSGPGDLGEGQPGRAEIDGSIRPSWEGIIRIPLPASSWQPKRLDLFLQATEAGQLGLCLSSLLPGRTQSSSLGGRKGSSPVCNSSFLLLPQAQES